jgi:hypothetical protein
MNPVKALGYIPIIMIFPFPPILQKEFPVSFIVFSLGKNILMCDFGYLGATAYRIY